MPANINHFGKYNNNGNQCVCERSRWVLYWILGPRVLPSQCSYFIINSIGTDAILSFTYNIKTTVRQSHAIATYLPSSPPTVEENPYCISSKIIGRTHQKLIQINFRNRRSLCTKLPPPDNAMLFRRFWLVGNPQLPHSPTAHTPCLYLKPPTPSPVFTIRHSILLCIVYAGRGRALIKNMERKYRNLDKFYYAQKNLEKGGELYYFFLFYFFFFFLWKEKKARKDYVIRCGGLARRNKHGGKHGFMDGSKLGRMLEKKWFVFLLERVRAGYWRGLNVVFFFASLGSRRLRRTKNIWRIGSGEMSWYYGACLY